MFRSCAFEAWRQWAWVIFYYAIADVLVSNNGRNWKLSTWTRHAPQFYVTKDYHNYIHITRKKLNELKLTRFCINNSPNFMLQVNPCQQGQPLAHIRLSCPNMLFFKILYYFNLIHFRFKGIFWHTTEAFREQYWTLCYNILLRGYGLNETIMINKLNGPKW